MWLTSNCEASAPFGAATLEDGATCVGAHPGAEAVNANAFLFFWLVGALGH